MKQKSVNRLVYGILSVLLLGAISIFAPELLNSDNSSKPKTHQVVNKDVDVKGFKGTNYDVLPAMTKIPVKFERTVDGDTVMLLLNGQSFKARYLMVDTPESVKDGVKPQPYGKDAAKRNEALLKSAKQVYVMFDNGPKADDYDRALAYVYADDMLVAEQLVTEGLASVSYVKPPNNTFEKELRQAQEEAKKKKLNIWSIPGYVNERGKFKQQ